MVDAASPIVYGYRDNLAIFASNPPVFGIIEYGGRRRRRTARRPRKSASVPPAAARPTIPIIPQGRAPAEIPEEPHAEVWEATPLTDEQLRNPVNVIPPAARPRVVLRYANAQRNCWFRDCSITAPSWRSTPP